MRSLPAPFVLAAGVCAQAAGHLVVPALYATHDAPSHCWLPGATDPMRQQTLIGPSHLGVLLGRLLVAIEFRRSAGDTDFAGGAANMSVSLSTIARPPIEGSAAFAHNIGGDVITVFQGTVTLPASPPNLGPAVSWSTANVVRIAFTQPFVYAGGTLCVDITGQGLAGQADDWWLADAAWEEAPGLAVDAGPGCGPFANDLGQWSFAEVRALVAGGTAELAAYGPAASLALAVLGGASPAPIPLVDLGLPAPGCHAYVGSIDAAAVATFAPATSGFAAAATWSLPIPASPWVLGAQATAQWLELSQWHASNGIRLTVGAVMPSLDMAAIEGHANDAAGLRTLHLAHVVRFEHQ